MSIVLSDNEVISNLYIDSNDAKYGTTWNFVCPPGQSFINFTRIKRIALCNVNLGFLPYTINEYNRYFTITNGTNSYQVSLPIGYYDVRDPSSPAYYIPLIKTAMDANPYGWVFTVSRNLILGTIEWTSTVPIRVSKSSFPLFDALGIRETSTLSASYTSGGITSGVYTNVLYICSKALTKNSVRDAHSNSIINNVLGIISVNDQFSGNDYYHVEKEYRQLKIFDFEPTEPIGSEVDVYFIDSYGREIFQYPQYDSNRITLEFKIVSTRNPSFTKTIPERS